MDVTEIYSSLGQEPNQAQRTAIETVDGPLRILAGPGSGKTHVLVLRALNLLVNHEVEPSKLVLVTFTEKAARELEDRLRRYAAKLPLSNPIQLAEVNVGTIHWFCGDVLRRYHPDLRRYEPLDGLSQQLFIYHRLNDIAGKDAQGRYLGRWGSKARAIGGLIAWFSKITEETITAGQLEEESDPFLNELAEAYRRYHAALRQEGFLDFAFILRELYDLFQADAGVLNAARQRYSHFMIDEYQDTNYVQEELLLDLATPHYNLAVVGDDDQSLYRFRGAEVRNILEFPNRFRNELDTEVAEVTLQVNYRSHPGIIRTYLDFMNDGNWIEGNTSFRSAHPVIADPDKDFHPYPAASYLSGNDVDLADVVEQTIESGIVSDPNQIALLFHSVGNHAVGVVDELRRRGIECYAPRAGKFLEHQEVRDVVGILWGLAGFPAGEGPADGPVGDTCDWARQCHHELLSKPKAKALKKWLQQRREQFDGLDPGEDMGASLLDLVYQAFRFEPFRTYISLDPIAARNLGHVTMLIRTFQQHFRFEVLHAGNRQYVPWRLWPSFFYLLETQRVDDVEDEEAGAPQGMVQVMTIHQSKGLEFPVVIVGSLNKRPSSGKELDRTLGHLYPKGRFEPDARITEFDCRREFYVAFSRAKHLLIAFADGAPHRFFDGLVSRVPDARSLDLPPIADVLPPEMQDPLGVKPLLSFTGHINVYRRCRRQYQLFNEFEFAPSFAAQVFFGTVVHQTIEDIHRHVLDERPEALNPDQIERYFQRNSELLRKRGVHPLAPNQREEALKHVMRYYVANLDALDRVVDTEVEVTLEQPDYVLNGRVDLVRGQDGELELVDFKAQKREQGLEDLNQYRDQLALYRYLLGQKYGTEPKRTLLYFTGEESAEDARYEVDVSISDLNDVKKRFDETAGEILTKNFELLQFPTRDTCRACDFVHFCERTGSDAKAAS